MDNKTVRNDCSERRVSAGKTQLLLMCIDRPDKGLCLENSISSQII